MSYYPYIITWAIYVRLCPTLVYYEHDTGVLKFDNLIDKNINTVPMTPSIKAVPSMISNEPEPICWARRIQHALDFNCFRQGTNKVPITITNNVLPS